MQHDSIDLGRAVVLWVLFALISAGLGYPTLGRYDPRTAGGTKDSAEYAVLVEKGFAAAGHSLESDGPRPRILVPFVARFVHALADGSTRSADPVFFGLLVANALFCASTALILADLGARMTGSLPVALLGAALYLLNFAVPNSVVAGMVDSGEAFLMLALAWAMYTGRWRLLPVIGVLGACAKETFVPFAAVFSLVWWLSETPGARRGLAAAKWIAALDLAAFGTMTVLWSAWYGELVLPWSIAMAQHYKETGFLEGLWNCLTSKELLYVFGWLVPLGLWRLGRLPKPWVAASLATAALTLVLGAWDDGYGNFVRAMFNVSAPVLSLSVAMFLAGPARS